ncbi:uncharacterized protein [Nicotiana sylvestris]|uniref:uncharacterized protein n=1 Tax=Nicotiana sylvestris TaxID=4096 RepID=UPI00388CE7EF
MWWVDKNHGLSDDVRIRPPLNGEEETSKPAKGKKRKNKAVADSPQAKKPKSRKPRAATRTSTSAFRASPSTRDKDDDKGQYHLVQRMRLGAGVPPVPPTRAPAGETVAASPKGSGPEVFRGQKLPLGDIDSLDGLNLGPQFSSGELQDTQDLNAANVGGSSQRGESKEMYDHALSRLREELSYHGKEIEKLASRLQELEASSARKEKELGELRASLEGVLRERAGLVEQIGQKNGEILELRKQNKAEQNLIRAVAHASAKARRQALEEASTKGVNLSTEVEKARELEENWELLVALDEGPGDGSEGSGDEECWRFFRDEAIPLRGGGETADLRVDNKRKESPRCEDAYGRASLLLKFKRGESADLPASEASVFKRSFPVPVKGTSRNEGHASPSSFPTKGALGDTRTSDIGSAFGEAQRLGFMAFDKLKFELFHHEARLWKALNREKSLRLLCARKESELVYLRCEVNRSRNCESRLKRQLDSKTEELERLWGEVGRAKREFNELRAQVDAQLAAKEDALSKASALEVQLRKAHANDSIRANMITRLESELLKAKVKVVNARAKAVMSRTRADQKVAAYLKGAAYARAELREAIDRESNSKEYVKCKPRRETLEEIHASGFDLSEEIKQAKAEEHDAKFLLFDAEDGEDGAIGPKSLRGCSVFDSGFDSSSFDPQVFELQTGP